MVSALWSLSWEYFHGALASSTYCLTTVNYSWENFHGTLKNCKNHESLAQRIFPVYSTSPILKNHNNHACIVAIAILFFNTQKYIHVASYVYLCSFFCNLILLLVTGFWKTAWPKYHTMPIPFYWPQLMATLIHYTYTVPLPGLVDWSAFLEVLLTL